jgi:hypothetical protein
MKVFLPLAGHVWKQLVDENVSIANDIAKVFLEVDEQGLVDPAARHFEVFDSNLQKRNRIFFSNKILFHTHPHFLQRLLQVTLHCNVDHRW